MAGSLLTPNEDVNYDAVMAFYLVCSVACVGVCLWELREESTSRQWIILAPYLPCLVWCFFVRKPRSSSMSVPDSTMQEKKLQ